MRLFAALFVPSSLHIPLLAILIAGCRGAVAPPAPASAEQPGVESLLGGSLVPSYEEDKLRRTQAMAGELARTLEKLDGVEEARVHLNLPDKSLLSKDKTVESGAAILVRRNSTAGPDEAMIRDLAVAAVPGLDRSKVSVFFSGAQKRVEKTVLVGPIEVASSSAETARVLIGGLLVACLLMASGLVVAGFMLRSQRRKRS